MVINHTLIQGIVTQFHECNGYISIPSNKIDEWISQFDLDEDHFNVVYNNLLELKTTFDAEFTQWIAKVSEAEMLLSHEDIG